MKKSRGKILVGKKKVGEKFRQSLAKNLDTFPQLFCPRKGIINAEHGRACVDFKSVNSFFRLFIINLNYEFTGGNTTIILF